MLYTLPSKDRYTVLLATRVLITERGYADTLISEKENPRLIQNEVSFILFSSTDHVAFASGGNSKEEEGLDVFPECAVVLVTAGSVAGGLASYALVEPLLSLIGFAGADVTEATFAAWLQSTMSNVIAGSIFSSLQFITIG